VEPNGPKHVSLPEVVDIRLLGPLRPLEPLVAWLPLRRAASDLQRLKQILEAPEEVGSG
jgi:hypothetical protein